MNKAEERPRRNANNDLSELVRILGKLEFEDFMSLFKIFENYRDKTSSLRIIRLLYDALSIGRFHQVKAIALTLVMKDIRAKSVTTGMLTSGKHTKRITVPLKKGRNPGTLNSEYEVDILDFDLIEKMRHKN